MASDIDKYLEANPELKKIPIDELLDQLYREVDRDEPFEQFAESVTTDPDSRLGKSAVAMGRRGMRQKPLEEERQEKPFNPPVNLKPERGEGFAAKEAIPESMQPPIRRVAPKDEPEGTVPKNNEVLPAASRSARSARLPIIGEPSMVGMLESAYDAAKLPGDVMLRGYRGEPMPREEMERRAFELGGLTAGTGAITNASTWAGRARPPSGVFKTESDPIMNRVVPHPERTPGELTNAFDRTYSKIYDEFHAVGRAEKQLTGRWPDSPKTPLLAEESPYKILRLSKGNPERMKLFVEQGTYDFITGERTGPGLMEIFKPVQERLPEAMRYAIAKRVVEKGGQDIKTGINPELAQAIVNQVERGASVNADQAAIVKFQQDLVKYNDALLKLLVDSGVVAKDSYRAISEANKDYLPFYRLIDPDWSSTPGKKSTTPIKGMTGSELEILDPIESVIRNTYTFIQISERNRAAQALYALIKQHTDDAGNGPGAQVGREITPSIGHNSKNATEELNMSQFLAENGVKAESPEPFMGLKPGTSADTINVMIDGKRHVLQVDPEIAKAWSFLDGKSANALVQVASYPARMLRAGITLDPGFALKNFIRDQTHAMVTTPGYIPVYDAFVGLGHYLNGTDTYFKWASHGGAQATRVAIDEAYQNVAKYRLVGRDGLKDAGTVAESPLAFLRSVSNAMENGTRIGAYQRAIKQGYAPHDAAYIARESTVDFQRMGQIMRELNMMTAFQNPNIQGVDRMARAIGQRPVQTTLTMLGGLTLPSLGLWYINKDDPRYQQMPRWQKDITWPVWIPGDIGGTWKTMGSGDPKPQGMSDEDWKKTQTERMPEDIRVLSKSVPVRQLPSGQWQADFAKPILGHKPFEVGTIFGSVLGERIPELFLKDNPDAFKSLAKSMERSFIPPVMPTFAAPGLELASNWSYFFDRPITSRSLERMLPEYRFHEFTTDTAKVIARGLRKLPGLDEVSPIAVDHWINAWTGTMGRLALDQTDNALRATGLVRDKVKPEPTNADMWLLRSFTTRYPATNAQSIQDFYEKYYKQEQVVTSLRALSQRPGTEEEAKTLRAEKMAANVKSNYDAMNAQRQFINDIMRNNNMTPKEKRELIDAETFRMIAIATDGNRKMKEDAKHVPQSKKAPNQQVVEFDARLSRFENLSNDAQIEIISKMLPNEQMKFAPFLKNANKVRFNNFYMNLDAKDQFSLMEYLEPNLVQYWMQFSRPEVREHYKAPPAPPPAQRRRRR